MLTGVVFALLFTVFFLLPVQPAQGAGMLDFMDSCIAAKKTYWDERKQIFGSFDKALAENPKAKTTKEFKDFWIEEKRRILREYFDEKYAPIILVSGGDVSKAFEVFWVKALADAGGMDEMDKIIDADFTKTRELALLKQKGATQVALDKAKEDLYDDCSSDVASQFFRGTVTAVSAPIGIVFGNFEAATNEKNVVTAAIRATSGISAESIKKDGPLGGKGSEARKACTAVAKIFGKKKKC